MASSKFTLIFIICLIILQVFLPGQASHAQDINYTTKNGVAAAVLPDINVDGRFVLMGKTAKDKIKVVVTKDNEQIWHDINLEDGQFNKSIWLTQGKGQYTIAVVVHESGKKYSYGPKFSITSNTEVNRFLVPTKHIESDHKDIISLAEELTKGKEGDVSKAKAIYDWVSQNIKYDHKKYVKHMDKQYDNNYGALHTLQTKKGVCYDYATLAAALGRAAGLQVKVVYGQGVTGGNSSFHAWNEFYCEDEERWIEFDVTFAVSSGRNFFDNADFDEYHSKTGEY